MNKKAIIFGGSGQDGSYMCKLLSEKNYKIISITRSLKKVSNYKKLKINSKVIKKKIDVYNKKKIEKLIFNSKCEEIYFFGGQTSPVKSYNNSYETIKSNIIPIYFILEILKKSKKKIKFYNASSCEIFKSSKKKQDENSLKFP